MPYIPISNTRGGPSNDVEDDFEVYEAVPPPQPRSTLADLEREDGWTVESFEDQPVKKADGNILMMNIRDRITEVISKVGQVMEWIRESANTTEESSPDDPMVEELEQMFIQAITQKDVQQIKLEAITGLLGELRQNKELVDPLTLFVSEVARRVEEYGLLTLRARLRENDDYIQFRSGLWELNHPDEPCPPMTTWLPRADDDETDDEDIEVGGQTQTYRCPMTLRPLEDAMTCMECKHSYSGAAIIDLVSKSRKSKRPAKCPQIGCNVIVTMANLQQNPTLQKRANEAERRKKRREEEADDNESDE